MSFTSVAFGIGGHCVFESAFFMHASNVGIGGSDPRRFTSVTLPLGSTASRHQVCSWFGGSYSLATWQAVTAGMTAEAISLPFAAP